jgi:hypothetical protein
VARCYQVASQIEKIRDSGVDADESLRLKDGLEPPHSPLPDPDEGFVHEERVTVAATPAPQPARVLRSKLVAPEADRLVADEDPSPSQEVLDVSMAEVEAMVEPGCMLNDGGRESVSLVEIGRLGHAGMFTQAHLTRQYQPQASIRRSVTTPVKVSSPSER